MKPILTFLWNSRTTVFGYLQVVLGVLATTDGMFTPKALKWILLGNGIATALLGHYNNLRIRQAAGSEGIQFGPVDNPSIITGNKITP